VNRGLLQASGLLLLLAGGLLAADAPTAAELNRRGAEFLQQGDPARALDQFRAAAKLLPGDPSIQFNVGLALFRLGRHRDALKPLGASLDHAPSAKQARYLRGVIYFSLGEFASCALEIEGLKADAGNAEHVLYMLVESYRNAGEQRRSREAFIELSSRFPESAFLNRLMGVAYDWQGDSTKALEEFRQALRKNPRMPEMAFAIGYIHFKQRHYDEARTWFARELALDPCYAKASYYLAEIEFSQERWDEAAARFRKAISCDPAYGDPYLGMGKALEQRGDLKQALAMYREGVRLKPRDRRAHYALAVALRRDGRHKESEAEFNIARKLIDEESKRIPLLGNPQN